MICMIISTSDFVNMCEKQNNFFFSNETRNAHLYERINKRKRSMGPTICVSDSKGLGHVRLIQISIYFVMNVLP